ncbi:hypothetical protein HK104_009175 [Borealophlyctis nickersoniae]|nr:hypothetical protein HK104_009175 [Borealophlyctis nickersoniae]
MDNELKTENQFRDITSWKIKWKGNNHKEQSGAQDHVLQHLTPGMFPVLSLTRKFGRMWAAVGLDHLLRLIKKNHGVYEILCEHLKRKIFFDVDKSDIPLEEVKMIILERFPGARLQISGRDGAWHIILSNYYAENLDAMRPIKRFAMMHVSKGFDKGVYTKTRNMKCINQSKPDKPVQAYIEGDLSLSKHLILHDFDDDAINIDTIDFGYEEEEVIVKEGKKQSLTLDILSIPQHDLPIPHNFDWLTATPTDKLAILPNLKRGERGCHDHDICWQVMTWCKIVGIKFEDFWAWNRRKDPSIPRYKRYLSAWQGKEYKISSKLIDGKLEPYFPTIRVSPSTQRLREQFDLDNITTVEGQFLNKMHIAKGKPGQPTTDKSQLKGIIVTDNQKRIKHSILAGPMGSNKTGATIDFIVDNFKPGQRVLWLTPRITLSNNTRYRLMAKKIGVVKSRNTVTGQEKQKDKTSFSLQVLNYRDFTRREKEMGCLDKGDFVICSIQSLHYLNKEFDYVVIDEIETVLNTFSGDACTHRQNLSSNWEMFITLFEGARKVI